MAKKKIVIEIEFDEVVEDEDYTYLEFAQMKIKESKTTVTEEQRDSLAESWSQSDWYSVGFSNSLLSLLNKGKIEASEITY